MTLEMFFDKFDTFADAPGAISKMRELVLQFAVQGKLSERLASDQTDPFWSEFISNPDTRVFDRQPNSVSLLEIPSEWKWINLSKAADCRAAPKVSPVDIPDSSWVLDLEDIDGGSGKIVSISTFSQRRSLSTKARFNRGDVLYGKLRPYLNKVVIAEGSGYCTTEIVPLRPRLFVIPGFLRIFLRSPHFLNYAHSRSYGMKMPRLGTKDLEEAQIAVPPLAEQKRIVAKVNELMALCDRLEAEQQERETRQAALARASLARFAEDPTPDNLNLLFHKSYAIDPSDLRKSILALAVQGKLVEQDTSDGGSEVILKQIFEERNRLANEKLIPKIKTLFEPRDCPFRIPSSWRWVQLGSISYFIDYGTSHKSNDDSSGIPVYRMGIYEGGNCMVKI